MTEHEDELAGLPLDEVGAAEPPAGFADRVMTAWSDEARPEAPPAPTRRRIWPIAAAAAAFAAVSVASFDRLPEPASEGSVVASSREEVAIGERAVAVAEPGADLSWRVQRGGETVVEQRRGAAFYRVEPGGSFVVKTPAGEARVTGTCFTLEVPDMSTKSHLAAAVGGAALTAALLLTVHEGSVTLKNDAGEVPVTAGERASVHDGAPHKLSPEERARTLAEENRLLAAERRALRAQNEDLEGQLKEVMIARANGEDPLVAENRKLKEQLESARSELQVAQQIQSETQGETVPFPEDLGPAYREDALKRAFLDVMRKNGLPGDIVGIDCNEYPCIVYGEFEVDGGRAESDAAWARFEKLMHEHYPPDANNHSIRASQHRDAENGQTKSLFGISVLPKDDGIDGEARENMGKRVRYRNQQFFDATWAGDRK